MQFRLTYAGPLLAASNNDNRQGHKHLIRRVFHKQLQEYWSSHRFLRFWQGEKRTSFEDPRRHMTVELAERFARYGYNFVPLVLFEWDLLVSVQILILRPQPAGSLIQSGDIDNRLKTIFDSLRMPLAQQELNGFPSPEDNERPFFCLLEDDRLITHTAIETDILLEPIKDKIDENDVRLLLTISITPQQMSWRGLNFAGQ